MLWFVLALATAFFESVKDVFSKRVATAFDPALLAFSLSFFSFVCLLPVVVVSGIPAIASSFWLATGASAVLNVFALVLFFKALSRSDLSLAAPLVALSPAFLLVFSPLVLGEFPSLLGLVGVGVVVAGLAVLFSPSGRKGGLSSLVGAVRAPGAKFMVGVALLWAASSTFDKLGVLSSSPFFFAAVQALLIALMLAPVLIVRRVSWTPFFSNVRVLAPIGFASACTAIFQFSALSMALVAYVISIKRLSVVFGVVSGHFLFGEKDVRSRLLGALLMLAGVVIIAFGAS